MKSKPQIHCVWENQTSDASSLSTEKHHKKGEKNVKGLQ